MRRAPTFLPPFSPSPVAFISHAAFVPPCATRRPRHVRPVILATAVNKAEEEIFIRRHTTERTKTTTKADRADKLPRRTKTQSESDEAQFDFIQDNTATPAAPIVPQTEAQTVVPQQSVQGGVAAEINGDHHHADTAKNQSDADMMRPVRVFSLGKVKEFGSKVGTETTRLVTESRVTSHIRMPTRRETVLMAWELALVLALLTLLRAGVASTLRWIHNRLNATRGLESNIPYEVSVFECMQRPLEFLSLFTVGTALAEIVSRPLAATGLLRQIRTLRELGFIISATWFLLRWIDRIRSRFAVDKRIDKAQVDATSRIATVATTIISLLISLDTIGINVQTVLAFGGIGGVAIGFAGREIISNFFGGFMIYVTRPFTVGEWIRSIEEQELNGTVEDIGWYLTRVRTWNKRPLYIPNSRFSTLIVENGSRMDNRRILHTLRLRLEDMPIVSQVVESIEALLMSHQELDPKQHRMAYVDSFGEYSVNIWISCYTKSVFLYDFRRVQQDILLRCHAIVREHGGKLANTNTRDVRPGIDTDRYGAARNIESSEQDSTKKQEAQKKADQAPVNNDVPGVARNKRPNPAEDLISIESGVRPPVPSASTQNKSTSSAVGAPSDTAPVATPDAVPLHLTMEPHTATVAAAVAALSALQESALEGDEKVGEEIVGSQVEGTEPAVSSTDTKGTQATTPAQMKISAAPPIRPASTPTAPNVSAAAPKSEAKNTDENTSSSANTQPGQSGSQATQTAQSRQGGRSTGATGGKAGAQTRQAKQGTATAASNQSTTTTATGSASKASDSTPTKRGSATAQSSTATRAQTGRTTTDDATGKSSGASGGSTAGVMHISKARKPMSVSPTGTDEGKSSGTSQASSQAGSGGQRSTDEGAAKQDD